MSGLVSTIIPVYNRAELLQVAVDSVLAQTWRPIEVIISDDGSTDDTPEAAQALVAAHQGIVRYVRNDNRGPGPAREAGRQLASGEFIQYLDSDDRLLPDKFSLQIAVLRARPDCGVAFGYTRLIDGEGRELRAPYKWTEEDRERLFPGLLVDRWWCTHTPLYRRSVTDAVGAWSNLRYSQDWEYDARVGALGTRLVNCHACVSEHRHHEALRQTGSGSWLLPADRVRFFATLYGLAREARVPTSAPEMKHFSRWVFRHARECGLLGDIDAARKLLTLASEAAGTHARDIKGYTWLVRMVGWRTGARLEATARALMSRSKGANTLRQSWMD
jgi:glycosyltransferase involved in cell wall biosynthesis